MYKNKDSDHPKVIKFPGTERAKPEEETIETEDVTDQSRVTDISDHIKGRLLRRLVEHFSDLEAPYLELALERFTEQELDALRAKKHYLTLIPSFQDAILMALKFPEYFTMGDIIYCLEHEITLAEIISKPHMQEYGQMFGGLDRMALSDAGILPDEAERFHRICFGRFDGEEMARAKILFGKKHPRWTFDEIMEYVSRYPTKFISTLDVYTLHNQGINAKKAGELKDSQLQKLGIMPVFLRK